MDDTAIILIYKVVFEIIPWDCMINWIQSAEIQNHWLKNSTFSAIVGY